MNCTIQITQADDSDVSDVMKVVRACTEAMRLAMIFQWDDIYPNEDLLKEDLQDGSLYVVRKADICLGAVSFNEKQEDAYQKYDKNLFTL